MTNSGDTFIQEWNLKKEFEIENNLLGDLLSILFSNKKNSLE